METTKSKPQLEHKIYDSLDSIISIQFDDEIKSKVLKEKKIKKEFISYLMKTYSS
jgi:hypothetical protein